jgi:uncharacterized Fe-S cluster-containing radical SAM superfamily protein
MIFNPLELAKQTEKIVCKGELRKYYRVSRPGRWYGGIATADCLGCCLRCVFCWSRQRDFPEKIGSFFSPKEVADKLISCAKKFGYEQLRISGNEPTLGKEHLLKLLELVDKADYKFILETNGILIGHDKNYSKELSKFDCLHVRVSLKGTNEREFSMLTGAVPQAFNLQLNALKNLLDAGVSCHPAVMLSFSPSKNFERLKAKLRQIDPSLEVEEEYVFLYPNVARKLNAAGIKPIKAFSPNGIPKELI